MTTLSVSVSEELKKKMERLEDINWSAVARRAFENKLNEVELFKQIVNKSKLKQKDAEDISNKINESIAKKFRSM